MKFQVNPRIGGENGIGIGGKAADAERDFGAFQGTIDANLEEFELFIEFLGKLQLLEAHFTSELKTLRNKYETRMDVVAGTATRTCWAVALATVQAGLETLDEHRRAIETAILDGLAAELRFQRTQVATIRSDMRRSFEDYNKKRAIVEAARKDYELELELGLDASHEMHVFDMSSEEATYRLALGRFERRRLVHSMLLREAFARCVELEARRVYAMHDGMRGLVRLGLTDMGRALQHVGHQLGQRVPSKDAISRDYVVREIEAWKDQYSVPRRLVFRRRSDGAALTSLAFGVALADHVAVSGRQVPHLLTHAFQTIEWQCHDVATIVRLYVSPEMELEAAHSTADVCALQASYEADARRFPWKAVPVTLLARLVQRYLMLLPEPVLPWRCHEALRRIAEFPAAEYRCHKLADVLRQLPPENVRSLALVCGHVLKLLDRVHDVDLLKHLALQFVPLLIRPDCRPHHDKAYGKTFGLIILSDFLLNYQALFIHDPFIAKILKLSPPPQ